MWTDPPTWVNMQFQFGQPACQPQIHGKWRVQLDTARTISAQVRSSPVQAVLAETKPLPLQNGLHTDISLLSTYKRYSMPLAEITERNQTPPTAERPTYRYLPPLYIQTILYAASRDHRKKPNPSHCRTAYIPISPSSLQTNDTLCR